MRSPKVIFSLNSIKYYFIFGLMLIAFHGFAQQPTPVGKFDRTQAKLGEPIHYSLVLEHSSALEFYFPDSTHDFSPFEYLDRTYFPTITDSLGNSYDSIVYSVATFELGEIQTLSVPAFLKGLKNPRPIYPKADSIQLIEVIQEMPDSVRLFENTTIAHVQKEFNYPFAISLSITFLLACLFIYLIFGGAIRNYFLLKRMNKGHLSFLLGFDKYIYEGNKDDIEPAVILWKSYNENLLNVPFTSYTTKEIGKILPEEQEVIEALKLSDLAIYAGQIGEGTNKKLAALKEYSQKIYQQRAEQIKKDDGDVTQLPPFFKWLPALADPKAHMALYSLFSLISYIVATIIGKKASLLEFLAILLFPFIAFLLTNYLSILAQHDKTKMEFIPKNTLLQVYGQAGIVGTATGIFLVMMSLSFPDAYSFLDDILPFKVGIIFVFPLLKVIAVSSIVPLYYHIFHKSSTNNASA